MDVSKLEGDKLANKDKELMDALKQSYDIIKEQKRFLNDKDKIIERLKSEVEKIVELNLQVKPILQENLALKEELTEKESRLEVLSTQLEQSGGMLQEISEIEGILKATSLKIQEIEGEKQELKREVGERNTESEFDRIGRRDGGEAKGAGRVDKRVAVQEQLDDRAAAEVRRYDQYAAAGEQGVEG